MEVCLNVKKPNVVFVFADQMRANATGYAGDPNVKTPNLDALAEESADFRTAVSCCPLCTPARASMITGQYPIAHGLVTNDIPFPNKVVSIADVFKDAGYDTGYIGKWHIDGHGRTKFIPKERRLGFDFWRVLECTHNYNNSYYYGDEDIMQKWEGYDAIAQTNCAVEYIKEKSSSEKPFLLFLSWGSPHNPYLNAPDEYKLMYNKNNLKLPPNFPLDTEVFTSLPFWKDEQGDDNMVDTFKKFMAGYYAHISALDDCIGMLLRTIDDMKIKDNTIFIFTSDHGDMLGSHGMFEKSKPYDESLRVPFLLRYPELPGNKPQKIDTPFNTPDIMPTILDLCGLNIPESVQGTSYVPVLTDNGGEIFTVEGALSAYYLVFGTWNRKLGGKEWRSVRTEQYLYVRDLNGPWLLFDCIKDPYQMNNLVNNPLYRDIQNELDCKLYRLLDKYGDNFSPGEAFAEQYGFKFMYPPI